MVTNSTLSANSASNGGGIENYGTLTVEGCTLSGNEATMDGGGIYNTGTLLVMNSTLSGNSAPESGGIANWWGSTLTMINSTLSGNSARWWGGGIKNFGTLTVHKTA